MSSGFEDSVDKTNGKSMLVGDHQRVFATHQSVECGHSILITASHYFADLAKLFWNSLVVDGDSLVRDEFCPQPFMTLCECLLMLLFLYFIFVAISRQRLISVHTVSARDLFICKNPIFMVNHVIRPSNFDVAHFLSFIL